MKTCLIRSPVHRAARREANSRLVVLVVVGFLLGAGLTAFWFHQRYTRPAPVSSETAPSALSAGTLAILQRLNSPIELHFYSLLDPATVPDATRVFAGRVSELLGQYEQAANGHIKVVRYEESSTDNANRAAADGLKPFNQDKGDACFLGIAVVHDGKKETLPLLAPEWEPALESDLSRAIARLSESSPGLASTATPPTVDPAVEAEVKRALPNLASISIAEGTRVLRQACQDELARTGQEMDARIKEAQQRFLEAQKNQSAADQEAARQQLVQLQAEQTQRIKQILANSQAQVEALERLKSSGQQ
jgi:ABC-type uncharacterized transport system